MLSKDKIEILITKTLAANEDVIAAAIYGSWAKNELHDDSDIDILILAKKQVSWKQVREDLDQIQDSVGRELHFAGYAAIDFLGKGISPYGFLARILSGELVMLIGDVRAMHPEFRSKDHVPRVARDRGIKYGGRHLGKRYPK